MDVFLLVISSAAIGIVVGTLSGLLGIGGGTILVPIFKLVFGLPAVMSTATSLFTIIPTSLSGAFTHFQKKTCIPLLGVMAGLGGACTSPLGVWLASVSPEWTIMVAAAIVIAYSAITMFMKAMKLRNKQKVQVQGDAGDAAASQSSVPSTGAQGKSVGPGSSRNEKPLAEPHETTLDSFLKDVPNRKLVIFGLVIGAVAGLMSGYIGVGGGFLMVPLFMQLLNTPMKLTSGTSLIAVMILAIPGTVTNAAMGNIDWVAGIFVALGAIPGAAIGSRFISRIPEFQLRLLFSGFLIVAAALLVLNQIGVF